MTWKTLIDESTPDNNVKDLFREYIGYSDSSFFKLLDEVYEELVKGYILEDVKCTEEVCRRWWHFND